MDLRVDNPQTSAAFVAACKAAGFQLPVRESVEDFGVIVDAAGEEVLTVDVNKDRDEDEVTAIMTMIIVAMNTCGGFQAERATDA